MKIQVIKQNSTLYPYSEDDQEKLEKFSNAIYSVEIKNMDIRTIQQNKAIWLWCDQIANLLNSKALYMIGVFGNPIVWTRDLVHTQIIKATIKQVYNIDSTTKLMRKELDGLIDFVTEAFARKGVEIPPFPSKELWDIKKERR